MSNRNIPALLVEHSLLYFRRCRLLFSVVSSSVFLLYINLLLELPVHIFMLSLFTVHNFQDVSFFPSCRHVFYARTCVYIFPMDESKQP